jgi:hypothetical protein
MYFFTDRPTQIYTSQPFSLHCNQKSIHVAGDHHGSRQNIRLVRTAIVINKKIFGSEKISPLQHWMGLVYFCTWHLSPNPSPHPPHHAHPSQSLTVG